MAEDLLQFFKEPHNREVLDALTLPRGGQAALLTVTVYEPPSAASPLAGKTVVFTGRLESVSRSEAKAQAESLGASVAGEVSRKTTYVLPGRAPAPKKRRPGSWG